MIVDRRLVPTLVLFGSLHAGSERLFELTTSGIRPCLRIHAGKVAHKLSPAILPSSSPYLELHVIKCHDLLLAPHDARAPQEKTATDARAAGSAIVAAATAAAAAAATMPLLYSVRGVRACGTTRSRRSVARAAADACLPGLLRCAGQRCRSIAPIDW
eukprot:3645608-Pleurochrysis_carterae.AAC.4